MWKILQHDNPIDLVLATDTTYTVEDFLKASFDSVDLDYKNFLSIDKKYYRPLDVNYLRGDFSKAKKIINWEPKVKFEKLVQIMVQADLERWNCWKKGEFIPWDAFHYPTEEQLISKEIRD
mgnify:CR=1 FL=1